MAISYTDLPDRRRDRGKILRGASPGELPIGEPDRFLLAVNLKTAKRIELTVPQPLLLLADQVTQ